MPSVSRAQKRLMDAVAHGWKKPGGGGPTEDVAKDFVAADKAEGKRRLPARIGKRSQRWA